jgi:hypothetical protein
MEAQVHPLVVAIPRFIQLGVPLPPLKPMASETHFSPTWRFFKPSLSPARTRFKEITNWTKIGFWPFLFLIVFLPMIAA